MSCNYEREKYTKPNLGLRPNAKVGDRYRLESYDWYLKNYPELFENSRMTPGTPIFNSSGCYFQKKYCGWEGTIAGIGKPERFEHGHPRMVNLATDGESLFHAWEAFLIPVKNNGKRIVKI